MQEPITFSRLFDVSDKAANFVDIGKRRRSQKPISFSSVFGTDTVTNFIPLNKHSGNSHTFDAKQIIAIDGEGYNDSQRDHHYDLLCAAGVGWNSHIWKRDDTTELTFEEIAEFLLSLADEHGKALYFIYGGSYDFNMWVKRLPDNILKRLNSKGKANYYHYGIRYRPRREIIISDRRTLFAERNKKTGKCRHKVTRQIHIYDVIGFFQSSFVRAIDDWQITDKETINTIASMKLKRGEFDKVNKDDILRYCLDECRLLVELGTQLREAAIRADIKPRAWYGAGALATTLLTKYGVKNHVGRSDDTINNYLLRAYFGGRTDISYVGFIEHGYHYDISSAYPTAMVDHPCMECGEWELVLDPTEKFNSKYSIWHVKWEAHKVMWGPFPYRLPKGSITYPCCGEGYYHKVEIDAARKLHPDMKLTILDGVVYTPNCNHQPFHFIPPAAKHRLELKAKKDAANKPLKLGLNSLYGKTAQSLGGHKNSNPPYQNFYWAGYTTAITRAKILSAIQNCKGKVLSIATDGIIANDIIPILDIGPNLGQWECTEIINGLLVKPGVYKWLDSIGKYHYGTRGFTSDEADWEAIESRWINHRFAGFWEYPANRFIGLRQAIHRGERWREYFGKWYEQTRKLTFMPELSRRDIGVPIPPWKNKRGAVPDLGSQQIPLLCKLDTLCRIKNGPSAPYKKKDESELTEKELWDQIDEDQP